MYKPKIAICFSGQPRAWKKAKHYINKFISEFDSTPDIFMHAWDFNSTSTHIRKASGNTQNIDTPIDKIELELLIKNYKPKGVLIESLETCTKIVSKTNTQVRSFMPATWDNSGCPSWLAPQYYGIKTAAELKRDYEIKNNFFYDVVIRMRYDTFLTFEETILFNFNMPVKLAPLTLYCSNTKKIDDLPFFIAGDILFYADSHTYDIVSDYVDYLPYIFKIYGGEKDAKTVLPEKLFSIFLQSMYLDVNPLVVDPKVIREDQYFEDLKKYKEEPYKCDMHGNDLSNLL